METWEGDPSWKVSHKYLRSFWKPQGLLLGYQMIFQLQQVTGLRLQFYHKVNELLSLVKLFYTVL